MLTKNLLKERGESNKRSFMAMNFDMRLRSNWLNQEDEISRKRSIMEETRYV
jgi:hypothetical protein